MDEYDIKLKTFLEQVNSSAEHMQFSQSCHSVEKASKAVNATPQDFIKSICIINKENQLIVGIIKGEDKVSVSLIAQILNIKRPRFASAEEILDKTGFPMGGVPPFGYSANFLIDPRVLEKKIVYCGGGSVNSLIKVSPNEIHRITRGKIVKIRK